MEWVEDKNYVVHYFATLFHFICFLQMVSWMTQLMSITFFNFCKSDAAIKNIFFMLQWMAMEVGCIFSKTYLKHTETTSSHLELKFFEYHPYI